MLLRGLLRNALVVFGKIPKPHFKLVISDHQPRADQMQSGTMVAVRGQREAKWVCFLCPCGSGEIVRLGLRREGHPSWSLTMDRLGRPTLAPSIWQRDRCHCHFWIRKGALIEC